MNRDYSIIFEIAPNYCILDSIVDCEGYFIPSKGFLPAVVDIRSSELNSPIPAHFSSLIPKMLMFTLAISCLTSSNLSWLMDLTFQVLAQYCSLWHQTLLSPLRSHPQWSVISTLAQPLHLPVAIFPPYLSSILFTYQPGRYEKAKSYIYIYIYIVYSSDIVRNEILPFATTRMDLEGIMLREISYTETY